MDILNFISWIRGGRTVTTVDPAQTLIPVGLKDSRRDDGYLAGAISVEDLVTQIVPEPAYKVYTALLTQSGGDNNFGLNSGTLAIGTTYYINDNFGNPDFTNVGAPNNNVGTYFVATGENPNTWGTVASIGGVLTYNTGAPVVTVLENIIGNVWFAYSDVGVYNINSDGLFTDNKTFVNISQTVQNTGDSDSQNLQFVSPESTINELIIQTVGAGQDGIANNTPIEIRVYN